MLIEPEHRIDPLETASSIINHRWRAPQKLHHPAFVSTGSPSFCDLTKLVDHASRPHSTWRSQVYAWVRPHSSIHCITLKTYAFRMTFINFVKESSVTTTTLPVFQLLLRKIVLQCTGIVRWNGHIVVDSLRRCSLRCSFLLSVILFPK